MTDDLISRKAALDALCDDCSRVQAICPHYPCREYVKIEGLPSAERKRGKWTEKHHAYSDEEQRIEEWQSCRCSECGRYDTRPYLYYFSEPRFCSWCGAEMVKGEDEEK